MNEQMENSIHNAVDALADTIKKVCTDDARVGVFYVYLDDDTWRSGDSGNMNMVERMGAIEFLKVMADSPEDYKK